jgi:hypothetical protein
MGEKEFDKRNYETALDLFQYAREKYSSMNLKEKAEECDEWIQKCQEELEKGSCLGTFLIFLLILFTIPPVKQRS